ncbi:uncharacterized protein FFB20_13884 [Fusarium fujikuroi]|nr:uncharacterized protein FFE2_11826 [Fusarium fujikuroi]SCO11765.1 uncharacterized protein FFB20_13884 [Fusarium fujikuroi]
MFSAFKTSYIPEVTSLIKKHGINDALYIKNLGFFVNNNLEDVGDDGYIAMSTSVRKIVSGLKDPIGLISSECQEGDFLAEHAHKIFEARGRTGPYSKYDLDYISWTVEVMMREKNTTKTMMAELCTKHGDLFDVEFEMRTEEGMKRLLTGNVEPPRDYTAGGDKPPARANVADPLFIQDEDMDEMTDPEMISTLAEVDMAISRITEWKERLQIEKNRLDYDANTLFFKQHFAKGRLKSLMENREHLKSLKR